MQGIKTANLDCTSLPKLLYPPAIVLLPLILTALLYWPGMGGNFILDDRFTLQALNSLDETNVADFVLNNKSGPTGRPVAMLSYLLDDRYYPGDPAKYKYTNLMIHLLCGVLLFLFLHGLLSCYLMKQPDVLLISGLAFTLWLVHPFNVSTTLYIAQRMAQLATLFILMGLCTYVSGRTRISTTPRLAMLLITCALIPFGLLATLSKETGILICLFILVTEFTMLRGLPRPGWLKIWLLIFTVLPMVLMVIYFVFYSEFILRGYEFRNFNLYQRLITESRILLDYLYNILLPQSAGTGLMHDDQQISTGLFTPITTILSALTIIALITLAFIKRKTIPVLSFSILWFFGGHLLESSIIPLELYFEHRNYLPMVGPLLGIVYLFFYLSTRIQRKEVIYAVKYAPAVLIILACMQTGLLTVKWGNTPDLLQSWYKEHPGSLRAATMHADSLLSQNKVRESFEILNETFRRHPDAIALPIMMLDISCRWNIPPAVSADQIISAGNEGMFHGILSQSIIRLLEAKLATNCPVVTIADIQQIITSVENIKGLRGMAKGELLMIKSDLYVRQKHLSPAVETLDEALKYIWSPSIPLRQAELLMSAGLVDHARKFLQKARAVDQARNRHTQSFEKEISALESRLPPE